MAKGITGANAVYLLSITDLFPAPQQLQGFAADDVFETDPLTSVETIMGVDGHMSAGFVFVEVKQNISIQADSDSNAIFEAWWGAQQVSKSVLFANGVIILTDVGTKWAMVNGVLSTFPPIPNAKKLLQPRRYGITWESITPAITT
jgi:hypothetical protein